MDWFDKEMEALEEQLIRGDISMSEFRAASRDMQRYAQEQEYREDIIAAGRGHLLR